MTRPRAEPHHDADGAIWVLSDRNPGGGAYFVSVQAGQDRIFSPADPVAYARAVMRAGWHANYAAGAARQLQMLLGDEAEATTQIVGRLRGLMPDIDPADTAPLEFRPGVGEGYHPFVHLLWGGERFGQWTVTDAAEHAAAVLELVEVCAGDNAYWATLRDPRILGVDEAEATTMVGHVSEHFDPTIAYSSTKPPPRKKKRRKR